MVKKTVKLMILSTAFVFIGGVLCVTALHMLTGTPVYAQSLAGSNIIDHHCTDLSRIPVEWIHAAKANLHIGYQHASHGRQPIEGMKNLDAFMGGTGLYDFSTDGIDRGPDVLDIADGYDHPGSWWYAGVPGADRITDRDDWVTLTRAFLDDPENADVNVIMWSWCNIVYYENDSTPIAYDVSLYLERMETLIGEYGPGGRKIRSGERTTPVTFVFMTGHTNPGADGRNPLTFFANKIIREHCIEHNRILYDFYDIECYNPDGEYFGDGEANRVDYGDYQEGCRGHGIHNLGDNTSYATDSCSVWSNRGNWGVEWQNQNREGVDYFDAYCPHCQEAPVLANLKAYAMWWLMAVLAGWNTPPTTSTTSTGVSTTTTTSSPANPCPSEAIYGENSYELSLLYSFRDNVLSKTNEGQEIIKMYYRWSPMLVQVMEADEQFKQEIKDLIDEALPMVEDMTK